MKSSLELLIEIHRDLEELRRLAQELPPEIARFVLKYAEHMEALARAIDQMA
ncbi:hypothetical protein [Bradyrhizobium yuanmingense]|uniref:hypothetical protein n=1 Tax=Bradyrhizobium yuanmingense TaxID=108015 RepID=UPI00187D18C7|nr:hypothetical protein [Bradyrhizobium yuanmingense]